MFATDLTLGELKSCDLQAFEILGLSTVVGDFIHNHHTLDMPFAVDETLYLQVHRLLQCYCNNNCFTSETTK